jgi:tRNA(Ile)-lysidine synthase
LRGTGLAGLAGIPATRVASEAVTVVRPLLACSRCEITAYLGRRGHVAREDSSNQQLHYTRNRIRLELLPWLEEQFNPQVRQAVLRLARIAGETHASLGAAATLFCEHYVQLSHATDVDQVIIRWDPRRVELTDHLRREIFVAIWRRQGWALRDMTFEHWQHLAELLTHSAKDTQFTLPAGVQASRQGGQVILWRPVSLS